MSLSNICSQRTHPLHPNPLLYPQDPHLLPMLEMYKASGRKVFLATNSLWDYTNVVMNYLIRCAEAQRFGVQGFRAAARQLNREEDCCFAGLAFTACTAAADALLWHRYTTLQLSRSHVSHVSFVMSASDVSVVLTQRCSCSHPCVSARHRVAELNIVPVACAR
jgi:hypothetical protein